MKTAKNGFDVRIIVIAPDGVNGWKCPSCTFHDDVLVTVQAPDNWLVNTYNSELQSAADLHPEVKNWHPTARRLADAVGVPTRWEPTEHPRLESGIRIFGE